MGVAHSRDLFDSDGIVERRMTTGQMRQRARSSHGIHRVVDQDVSFDEGMEKEDRRRRRDSLPTSRPPRTTSNQLIDVPTMYEIRQMMLQSKGIDVVDHEHSGAQHSGSDYDGHKNVDHEVSPVVDEDQICNRLQRIDETIRQTDDESKSVGKESDSDDQSSSGRPTRRRLSLGALTAPLGRQLFGKQRSSTIESDALNTSQDSVKQKSPKFGLKMFRKKGTPVSSVHTLESDEAEDSAGDKHLYKKRSHTYSATEGRKLAAMEKPALMAQLSSMSTSSDDSGIDAADADRVKEEKNVERRERTKKKRGRFGEKMARVRSKSLGYLFGDKPAAPLFGTSYLNREWEIVTVKEMCRRLSLEHIDHIEMPIPEGSEGSQVLDQLMVRQVMEILPARAEGYPWVNIYNSEKHGFSLATLYRKMAEFDEDMSPVLLIVRDTREHVFGAIVSGAIRTQEGYSGTGDSCLLWRFTGEVPHTRELRHYTWTGDNQFFVNASKECLSIGAGGGHYGLWLDADLNHGSSRRCETFDNEPLAGEKEDFIIQFIEAYGFRM